MQTIVRNLQGMAVSFNTSQLVNIRATSDAQLLQVFRNILPNAVNEMKPIALIQTKLSSVHRQFNTLKAIMVSPTYWANLLEAATEAALVQLNVYALTSEFLQSGDRFVRVLSRLSPRQERKDKVYEIITSTDMLIPSRRVPPRADPIIIPSGLGVVDLDYPFVAETLSVTGATADSVDAENGLVYFAEADGGKLVEISFVTAPVFNIVKVIRGHESHNDPYAYVMHAAAAELLGVDLPLV